MSNLNMMVTITNRSQVTRFLSFYNENQVDLMLVTLGRGTANSDVLDYLGLEQAAKAVLVGVVTDEVWGRLKKGLEKNLRIDVPGTGIAFTVPLSSVGGRRELLFLTEGQNFEKKEESALKDTTHELIIAITNLGYSDMVMDAAKSAGAAGGTVIHAKGTGMERAEKFLGISLASEKEMVFIVTKTAQKNELMKAVMKGAGMDTKAKTIVFSLPVTGTAGLRLLEDE